MIVASGITLGEAEMVTADKVLTSTVRQTLSPGMRDLLRAAGTDDYGSLHWATFSDDGGMTLVVKKVDRDVAREAWPRLCEEELRDLLSEARSSGVRRVDWD